MLVKVNSNNLYIDDNILEYIDSKQVKEFFTVFCSNSRLSNFTISIKVVTVEEIKELNNSFAGLNYPTDILTFEYEGGADIVVCPEVIQNNSNKYMTGKTDEFWTVITHGLIHSLGLDHQTLSEQLHFLKLQNQLLIQAGIDLKLSSEFFDRIKE